MNKLCGTRIADKRVVNLQRQRCDRHKDCFVEKETNFTTTLPDKPVVKELWCMRFLDAHNTHLLGQNDRGETMENRWIDESVCPPASVQLSKIGERNNVHVG